MNTKVAFITESSEVIGYGHLYRCIALSQKFIQEGYEVTFFYDAKDVSNILSKNFKTINI